MRVKVTVASLAVWMDWAVVLMVMEWLVKEKVAAMRRATWVAMGRAAGTAAEQMTAGETAMVERAVVERAAVETAAVGMVFVHAAGVEMATEETAAVEMAKVAAAMAAALTAVRAAAEADWPSRRATQPCRKCRGSLQRCPAAAGGREPSPRAALV
eukprot:2990580-Prymnesium_polylepis.1